MRLVCVRYCCYPTKYVAVQAENRHHGGSACQGTANRRGSTQKLLLIPLIPPIPPAYVLPATRPPAFVRDDHCVISTGSGQAERTRDIIYDVNLRAAL